MSYPETNFNDNKKRLFYCRHQKRASSPCLTCRTGSNEAYERRQRAGDDMPRYVNEADHPCKICSPSDNVFNHSKPWLSHGDNGGTDGFEEKWISADGVFIDGNDKPINDLDINNWPDGANIVHKQCAGKEQESPIPDPNNPQSPNPRQQSRPQGDNKANDKTLLILWGVIIIIMLGIIIYLIRRKVK